MTANSMVKLLVLIPLVSLSSLVHAAVPGALDPGFSADGKVITEAGSEFSVAEDVIQQADGKLVAIGRAKNPLASERIALVRYRTNGAIDSGFGNEGIVNTPVGAGSSSAFAGIQQSDGAIVVAGHSFNVVNDDFTLVRYTGAGVLDTSFNGTGIVVTPVDTGSDGANAVVQDSDKTLTAAGSSRRFSGRNDFALVRYRLNGTLDTGFSGDGKVTTDFGNDGDDVALALIKQADGKLVAAGYSHNGSDDDFAVARYHPDGSLDRTFSSDGLARVAVGSGQDRALSIVQQADGKLVLAGFSVVEGRNVIALVRFNTNGTLDTSFSADGKVTTAVGSADDRAFQVVQLFDGKLLVAGYTRTATDDFDFVLVRYNANGTLDTRLSADGKLTTSFGSTQTPGIDQAFAAVLQSDGNVVLAGTSDAGGIPGMALARYLFDDEDNDGIKNEDDNCPYKPNPDQADNDGDGEGDACDDDDDNDGVPDKKDACPFDETDSVDSDGDRICDNADPDDDNDGVPDEIDPAPLAGMAGARANDSAGSSVASAGDVDGDGFDDIIVGIPKSDPVLPGDRRRSNNAGTVIVYAGKTALAFPHLMFTGGAAGDEFGIAVAGAGDVNGDGVPDILVGAHKADVVDPVTLKKIAKNAGRAVVYSGSDGAMLFDFYGEQRGDGLGRSVAIVGDTDGDGFDDVMAGAWKADGVDAGTGKRLRDAGAAYLYSGRTHALLHKFDGEGRGDQFGFALASSDVDNDSRPDLFIGAPLRDVAGSGKKLNDAGSAYLFSAVDFSLIRRLEGIHRGDRFGFSVAGIADINGDSRADLLVGAPKEEARHPETQKAIRDSGTVHLFSGLDGSSLDPADPGNFVNKEPQPSALFGSAIGAAGDFNNDSIPDFVVGSHRFDADIVGVKEPDAGRISVHAGNTGIELFSQQGTRRNGLFGFAVAGGGDQNDDGFSDLLIGVPKADPIDPATSRNVTNAGRVEVVSGRSIPPAAVATPP